MIGNRRPHLTLLHAAAELSWSYPCIVSATLAMAGRALPFEYGLGIFALAVVVAHFSLARGLRNVWIVTIQTIIFALAALVAIHRMDHAVQPLFSTDWILSAFHGPHGQTYWFRFVLTCLSVLCYWLVGAFLARRETTYRAICSRFDIGLAAFFALFLLEMIAEVKGGPLMADNSRFYSLFAFLLFGLLAIAMARTKPIQSRRYLPGYGVVGIVASFSAAIVIAVGSVVLFFLPALQKVAEVGYSWLGTGGRLVGSFILPVLRFILGPRGIRPDPPSSTEHIGSLHYVPPTTWYGRLMEDVMMWGAKGILVLLALFAAGVILFFLARWLLASSRAGAEKQGLAMGRRGFFSRLWFALITLLHRIKGQLTGYRGVHDLYRALGRWGTRSGLPPRPAETPAEFGHRLARFHPQLGPNVQRIVSAFNRETYGRERATKDRLSELRGDLRSLRSPRHWLRRLKTRLTSPEEKAEAVRGIE
jgi:hypothetical protein